MAKKEYSGQRISYRSCATLDKTLVYVLRGTQGDMLIDTGRKISVHFIESWLRRAKYDIKWIFLTHGHFDHAYNAAYLKNKFGAKVIIHEKDADMLYGGLSPEMLPSSEANISAAKNANRLLQKIRVPVCEPDILLTDEDTDILRTLGFDADVVMLPGHTPGSVGIHEKRVLYCGDACAARDGEYYTALFGSDIDALHRSEKKILEINPLIIAPGHGKFIINEKAFKSKMK